MSNYFTLVVYHVYILASSSGVIYTGVSNHLERRIAQHKSKQKSGFSTTYNTIKLVYFEPYTNIRDAIAREKQLKRWRREKKVALIEKDNPHWRDLSENFLAKASIPRANASIGNLRLFFSHPLDSSPTATHCHFDRNGPTPCLQLRSWFSTLRLSLPRISLPTTPLPLSLLPLHAYATVLESSNFPFH